MEWIGIALRSAALTPVGGEHTLPLDTLPPRVPHLRLDTLPSWIP